jgi:hypothetical protein
MPSIISLMLGLVMLLHGSVYAAEAPDAQSAATGDKNPFASSYVNRGRPAIALAPDSAGPKVYRGEDQVDDYQRMLENGYDMLGYSEFFAGENVSPDLVTQHARDIKADLVLVYTKLSGEVPAGVKVQQMREQAKTGSQEPAGSKDSYTYFASYWVKLAPPLLGVHVSGPPEDSETEGLKVIAVINDSPAHKAGIQDGDVLGRLGDVVLKSPAALTEAAQKYAGQTVDADVRRDGASQQVSITLNNKK